MAMEESRVLIWHRDKLKLSIMTEPFLQVVFDHILGRDVVKKLMQVTQVRRCSEQRNLFSDGFCGWLWDSILPVVFEFLVTFRLHLPCRHWSVTWSKNRHRRVYKAVFFCSCLRGPLRNHHQALALTLFKLINLVLYHGLLID